MRARSCPASDGASIAYELLALAAVAAAAR